jgi:hypothetical protein
MPDTWCGYGEADMTLRDWIRPELIVLSRGTPEEAVLTGCKGGPARTSFLAHHDSCHSDEPACTTMCSSLGAS